MRAGITLREPLLIIGGPPCQPFSKAAFWSEDGDDAAYRRARARGEDAPHPGVHEARSDDRRTLVGEFLRLVIEADADGFVFENVASLAAPRNRPILDDLIGEASTAGYHARFVRANAAEFGAPQKRDRVFVLAAKTATPVAPSPTHTLDPDAYPDRARSITAGEVLKPFGGDEFHEPEEIVQGRWAEHLRSVPPGWNYKAHTAWGGHPDPTFVTETRFWNFLLKLSADRPSWTIPAILVHGLGRFIGNLGGFGHRSLQRCKDFRRDTSSRVAAENGCARSECGPPTPSRADGSRCRSMCDPR